MKKLLILPILLAVLAGNSFSQPSELPGFPISYTANWGGSGDRSDRGSTIADLTGDGKPEVIVIGGTNRNSLFVYNYAATLMWTLTIPNDPLHLWTITELPVVGDIDSDGDNDLAVAAWWVYGDGDCPLIGACEHNSGLSGHHYCKSSEQMGHILG
jgi:hypothetical protein